MYEVYATDKDEGLNGAVRYSFLKTTGNRDWEYFTIDPISGLIQTAQRLDREKQAVYSVRGRGPVPGAGPAEKETFLWAEGSDLSSGDACLGPFVRSDRTSPPPAHPGGQ